MPEIIYVLTNEAMPGLVKIGRTEGAIGERLRQLDTTSVPLPFECFCAVVVADADRVERAIHEAFGDHRVRRNREFFRLSPDKPKAIIDLLCIQDVTPQDELIDEVEDAQALDAAKRRRANFSFDNVRLKAGTILQSVFDEAITCEVAGDRKVIFRGEETSLSSSALKIAHEKGYGWTSIAGPDYWKYDGKTLSELRDDSMQVEPV